MNCVEETRKDIERRRAVTLARSNNLNSSLHMGTKKHDDSLASAIKNEQFTASDKRKVLELLLSNENVLLFLYEKLFPRAMTTENLLSQAHHLQGTTDHSYTTANMGFHQRAKSSAVRMPKNNAQYSKSQRQLKMSMTGNPIKFRDMSSAGFTEATRSNSNLGLNPRR